MTLGFDDRFRRLWNTTSPTARAALSRNIDVRQMIFAKAQAWRTRISRTCSRHRFPDRVRVVARRRSMEIADAHAHSPWNHRCHRPHAADQARARIGSDRLHHPRQGRIHESRPVGQGPRGAVHHRGCGEARRAAARRRDRRGHRGQYRHRPGAGRQALGFRTRHRHPDTQSQEKKDMLRLCGAELVEVPAVPYAEPEQLREGVRPPRRAARKTEPNGAIWANQFDNVANRDGHIEPPARKSGSRPTARSTASSARSAPAARWPASASRSRSATRT